MASDEQLLFCDPFALHMIQNVDVLLQIHAPINTRGRSHIPTERVTLAQQGSRPIMETYLKRVNDQSLRWNITAWPTQASAQEAEMAAGTASSSAARWTRMTRSRTGRLSRTGK